MIIAVLWKEINQCFKTIFRGGFLDEYKIVKTMTLYIMIDK